MEAGGKATDVLMNNEDLHKGTAAGFLMTLPVLWQATKSAGLDAVLAQVPTGGTGKQLLESLAILGTQSLNTGMESKETAEDVARQIRRIKNWVYQDSNK